MCWSGALGLHEANNLIDQLQNDVVRLEEEKLQLELAFGVEISEEETISET